MLLCTTLIPKSPKHFSNSADRQTNQPINKASENHNLYGVGNKCVSNPCPSGWSSLLLFVIFQRSAVRT